MDEPNQSSHFTDLMAWAGQGDRESLKLLALGAVGAATNGEYIPGAADWSIRELLTAAETFARLAAFDADLDATRSLAAVLVARSDDFAADLPLRSQELWQEAAEFLLSCALAGCAASASFLIEELTRRADRGGEEDAVALNRVIDALPPELLAAARSPETIKAAA